MAPADFIAYWVFVLRGQPGGLAGAANIYHGDDDGGDDSQLAGD